MKQMKKTMYTLFLAMFLLLALPIPASAEEYTPATFKTTPFEAVQSGEITTTLYLEENSNLIDFEFQLAYDPELVTLKSAMQAVDLAGDMEITEKDNAVHISYTRTSENLTRKADLAVLTFTVDENVGPGSYDFLMLDEDYHSEAHTMVNDDLYVLPMETVFAPLDIYNAGDINLSHSVSIADVTTLRQHLALMRTLTEYQMDRADAYYDKDVSIADAVRIQQYLANHSVQLGNRVNITFIDKDGAVNKIKSVLLGGSLTTVPQLPEYTGYYGGFWSLGDDDATGADFRDLQEALTVYAVYKKDASPAVTFYKERLSEIYYAEKTLTGSLNLINKLTYQEGYTADIYWRSSNSAVLNASTGQYTKPSYDSSVTLTATIISYLDGVIEAQDYIAFDYSSEGEFLCPTKAEIEAYLKTLFATGIINNNMTLPVKVTNENVNSDSGFEVRLDWLVRDASGERSANQLTRSNQEMTATLIAVATFNGIPLEGDGRIYFDGIILSPVSQEEIRSYIINQIAANTGISLTNGEELWHDDTRYGATIKWISQNNSVATIENNIVSIKDVVNGTALPLNVEVTYTIGSEVRTFTLAYTTNVVTDNALLVPGTNIDPYLYNALKSATGVFGNLTTDALKNVKFVYLDLSAYPEIQDLTALTYCTNLRVLNISGLHVDENSLNQICTLNKLEALIANNCGISTMTVGGVPVLDKMINLKMLDLSYNELTSLDSVLSKDNRYGQMQELYLNNNQLTDISALCEMAQHTTKLYNSEGDVVDTATEVVAVNRAPMLQFLTLDNNHLTDEDIAAFGNFKVMKYLSLGNNDLTSVSNLKGIRTLLELHLQGNRIEDVRDLRYLTHLQSLYLSHNKIRNVFAGARETNLSYLRYLTDMEILYLNDNDIEDISDLATMYDLAVLNVNNNRIQSLSVLADKGETMVELYAENNEIDSFSFIRNLTGLERLMLSGNNSVYESALTGYLSGLTKLRTLTLSGKDLRSLAFLNGMNNLIRLDVADCNLPSYYIGGSSVNDTELVVTSYSDNIASLLSLKDTLRYLDVSNNGLAYGAAGVEQYMNRLGSNVEIESVSFTNGMPLTFNELYELTNLKVLYADNLADPVDASHLFSIMTGINYLSMENCGIRDASWLSKFRGLVYLDLAGNELKEFDLGNYISIRSRGTLEYLYIDSKVETEFANAYSTFDGNVLKEFSAENVQLNAMDFLPDMSELEYLNLSYSDIEHFEGDNEDFAGWFNLSRYQNLSTLDISGVQADIDEIKSMSNLKTLYAISGPEDALFQKDNLMQFYDIHNSGVSCYLYDYENLYEPKTAVEGKKILDTLDDIGCEITVASQNVGGMPSDFGVISNNNPALPTSVNGFDITWSVSNTVNYEIVDNHVGVKSLTDIDDEDLVLTASIEIYPNQAPATRDFVLYTHILRASIDYLEAMPLDDYVARNGVYHYRVKAHAAVTEGFGEEGVMPVNPVFAYSYSAQDKDGNDIPYTSIARVEDDTLDTGPVKKRITIDNNADFDSKLTIHVEVGHRGGEELPDMTIDKTIQVVSGTYTLTYVPNGGTVRSLTDGSTLTSENCIEASALFEGISVTRPGYTFTGWYTDEQLSEKAPAVMPQSNLTVYAGWEINTYTVNFESNGGSAVGAQRIDYGNTVSDPGAPIRNNYRFLGWYTDSAFTREWEFGSAVTGDMTLYAKWIYNEYTVTFNANGGTGGTSRSVLYGSTVSAPSVSRTGYSLTGWYTDSACTAAWNLSTRTVTGDVTLYAGWEQNTYTVYFDGNGGSVGNGNKNVVYANTYGSLPVASRTGYNFNGWYSLPSGGTRIYDSTKVSTAQNHTLYAQWSIIRVTIPNFSGNSASYAESWCRNNGINYSFSYAYDWTVSSGTVRSNTLAGSTVNYGSSITIYVSSGAKPIAEGDYVYVVPNTKYTAQANGGGSYGYFGNGRYGYVKAIYGGANPYNIDWTGWVPANAVQQRTN